MHLEKDRNHSYLIKKPNLEDIISKMSKMLKGYKYNSRWKTIMEIGKASSIVHLSTKMIKMMEQKMFVSMETII